MTRRTWRSIAPPAIVAAVALGGGAWPLHHANSSVDDRRTAAELQMAELQAQATRLTTLVGDDIAADLVVLDQLIPADFAIASFIVELDAITDSIGLDLRDVVPNPGDVDGGDGATPAGWSSVELSVRVVGEYLDLIDFAEAITQTSRLAVIDTVTITDAGQDGLDAAFALRLFRNDDPSDPLIARYVESRPEEVQP